MATELTPDWRWVESFAAVFEASGVTAGDEVVVVDERGRRADSSVTARMALGLLGASVATISLRSQDAESISILSRNQAAVAALAAAGFVVDCTVVGIHRAPELDEITSRGTRGVTMAPMSAEALASLPLEPSIRFRASEAKRALAEASSLRIRSDRGTWIEASLRGSRAWSNAGYPTEPGTWAHWPGGEVAATLDPTLMTGRLVMAPPDLVVDHGEVVGSELTLCFERGVVVEVEGSAGEGLVRSVLALGEARPSVGWIGWGLNQSAAWPLGAHVAGGAHESAVSAGVVRVGLLRPATAGRRRRWLDLALGGCGLEADGIELVGGSAGPT